VADFYKEISLSIASAMDNFYPDNFDRDIRVLGFMQRAMLLVEKLGNAVLGFFKKNILLCFRYKNNYYVNNIEAFASTFYLLNDAQSQNKYIELLTYKMLGFTKVKLSITESIAWQSRDKVMHYQTGDTIPVNFRKGYLSLYDLRPAGYDLKLYFVNNGILVDFIMQQYNYADLVCVNSGDTVIDAGGCWGDTALYFCSKGAGKVFVYEFIPSNIIIFNQNVSLNPQYQERIKLIDKAVWETSGIELSFNDRGPGSQVAEAGRYQGNTQTLSIDNLVANEKIGRVDFIKMDIEGAEFPALKGAANTIREHKPKLAIAVYHKPDDLIKIPAYILSLNPDYLFYLDYFTIIAEEIVLYAIDKKHVC